MRIRPGLSLKTSARIRHIVGRIRLDDAGRGYMERCRRSVREGKGSPVRKEKVNFHTEYKGLFTSEY